MRLLQGKNILSKAHRPEEIGTWFQYGRRWDKQPLIPSDRITGYVAEWWEWWCGLQPNSRGADPQCMSREITKEYEWDILMKGGQNGLFVVLLALYWWFLSVEFDGDGFDGWNCAMNDVQWTVGQMKICLDRSRKRTRDEDEEDIDNNSAGLKRYFFCLTS